MHLFHCIWQGSLTGISMSLMLGTVFFSLIKNSLAKGYQTGIYIGLGVIVCDAIYVIVSLLSHSFSIFLQEYKQTLSLIGGIILIISGIYMFIKAKPKEDTGKIYNNKSNWYYFFNGFVLNLINPINFLSVFAISSILTIRFNYTVQDKIIFFIAFLATVLLTEIGISYGASYIKKWITPVILKRINQVSAIVFIGIGIKLAFGIYF